MDWVSVWRRKGDQVSPDPSMSELMALNGYDTGAGRAEFEAMGRYAATCAKRLGIGPYTELLEIGCGGGAWLYHHYTAGTPVSGADISPGHLKVAKGLMPGGRFVCADAAGLPYADASFDVAFAGACFLYLADWEIAENAFAEIARVLRDGGRGAITDLPDFDLRAEGERIRRGTLGEAEYDRLYAGLKHQYFDRERMTGLAESLGLHAETTTQEITGYGNSAFRFNIWFEKT